MKHCYLKILALVLLHGPFIGKISVLHTPHANTRNVLHVAY